MKAWVIHLFRRNPYSSCNLVERQKNTNEVISSERVHKNNHFQVLSYYDGMCKREISDMSEYIDERYCKGCVGDSDCEWREMAIHCERKKILLYSDEDEAVKVYGDKTVTINNAPLFALISIRVLMNNNIELNKKTMVDDEEKKLKEIISSTQFQRGDIVYYKTYQSLVNDDIFLMLHVNDWLSVERLLTHIRIQYSLKEPTNHQYLHTYTILGYDKSLLKNDDKVLNNQYIMDIRVQLVPGIDPCSARTRILNSLPKTDPRWATSIAGNYDLDIRCEMSLRQYMNCLLDNEVFGWHSPVSLRTNTSICFTDICDGNSYGMGKNELYYQRITAAAEWLKERMQENHDRRYLFEKAGINETLYDNVLTVYRHCCQQLVRPMVWGMFLDIKEVLQLYFNLVDEELEEIIKMHEVKDTKDREIISPTLRKDNLEESLTYMLDVFKILTNERLSIDFPSYETVGNSIFEKGAYEELIQCWTKWLNIIEDIGSILDNYPSRECRSRVKFVLVPHLYMQTNTNIQFPFTHGKERVAVVNISISEMVRFKEMMSTLVHEAGHYSGITLSNRRKVAFLWCVNNFMLDRLDYFISSSFKSNQDKFMVKIKYKFIQTIGKYLLRITANDKSSVFIDTCGHYLNKFWIELVDEGKIEGEDDVNECYYDLITNYSLSRAIEALSVSNRASIKKSCSLAIDFFRSLFRELNADMMMIQILDLPSDDYIQILANQKYLYMNNDEEEIDIEEDHDSIWTLLYFRIICILFVFYMEPYEIDKNDNISLLSRIKNKLYELKNSSKNENSSSLIDITIQKTNMIMNMASDTESYLSKDPTYWLSLLKCLQLYIFSYMAETIKRFKLIKKESKTDAERIDRITRFYHQFGAESATGHSVGDLALLLKVQKGEDSL